MKECGHAGDPVTLADVALAFYPTPTDRLHETMQAGIIQDEQCMQLYSFD